MRADPGEHLADALAGLPVDPVTGAPDDADVHAVLTRLGDPREIVRAEGFGVETASRWGALEIAAVVLLAVGGFVVPVVATLVVIVLVWVSPQWTRHQKRVATGLVALPVVLLPLFVSFYLFRPLL